jgi:uncharacterized protein DUF6174
MNTPVIPLHRLACFVASALIAVSIGCADESPATGLDVQQAVASRDTIPGTGELSELQARRATWVSRGIDDYRFTLQISCFCGGDITRPVLIEVRGGAIAKVRDVATGKAIANVSAYPTITRLFDAAIAERSRGGNVSVTYDEPLGIPARLEVGTIANDAGVLYFVGSVMRL